MSTKPFHIGKHRGAGKPSKSLPVEIPTVLDILEAIDRSYITPHDAKRIMVRAMIRSGKVIPKTQVAVKA